MTDAIRSTERMTHAEAVSELKRIEWDCGKTIEGFGYELQPIIAALESSHEPEGGSPSFHQLKVVLDDLRNRGMTDHATMVGSMQAHIMSLERRLRLSGEPSDKLPDALTTMERGHDLLTIEEMARLLRFVLDKGDKPIHLSDGWREDAQAVIDKAHLWRQPSKSEKHG